MQVASVPRRAPGLAPGLRYRAEPVHQPAGGEYFASQAMRQVWRGEMHALPAGMSSASPWQAALQLALSAPPGAGASTH